MKIADVSNLESMKEASRCAEKILSTDPDLKLPEHRLLSTEVRRLFARLGEGGFNWRLTYILLDGIILMC